MTSGPQLTNSLLRRALDPPVGGLLDSGNCSQGVHLCVTNQDIRGPIARCFIELPQG
jgi:hypothetical protein